MKYKLAREIINKIKTYNEIDGDLIIFKKPFNKKIRFEFKDETETIIDLRIYNYISLSNHGFLFIQNEPYRITSIHLNNVKDLMVI